MRVDVSWCGFYSEPEPERKASGGIGLAVDRFDGGVLGEIRHDASTPRTAAIRVP